MSLTDLPQTCSSSASLKHSLDLAASWPTYPANAPARPFRIRSVRVRSPTARCRAVWVCIYLIHSHGIQGRICGHGGPSTPVSPVPIADASNANKCLTDMARYTAATCGLSNESQSKSVIIAVSFFFCGTAVFVMLRTWSKLLTRTLYAEDHIITFAVTLAMAPFVCVLYSKWLGQRTCLDRVPLTFVFLSPK